MKYFKPFIGGFIFFGSLIAISAFWSYPFLLFSVLVILSMFLFLVSNKKETYSAYFVGAFFGPLAEIICIHFGAWSYGSPQILGIPVWLPLIWGIAGVSFTKISKKLVN